MLVDSSGQRCLTHAALSARLYHCNTGEGSHILIGKRLYFPRRCWRGWLETAWSAAWQTAHSGFGPLLARAGVWNNVDHLLVLATPFTIHLIGVEFDDKDQLQFIPDSIHKYVGLHPAHRITHPSPSLPGWQLLRGLASTLMCPLSTFLYCRCTTDNVSMTCIVGTPEGRIFMAGNDGALHELYYQRSKTRLFPGASKWRKINHTSSSLAFLVPAILKSMISSPPLDIQQMVFDETRNVLYLRSETEIQVCAFGCSCARLILFKPHKPTPFAELSGTPSRTRVQSTDFFRYIWLTLVAHAINCFRYIWLTLVAHACAYTLYTCIHAHGATICTGGAVPAESRHYCPV